MFSPYHYSLSLFVGLWAPWFRVCLVYPLQKKGSHFRSRRCSPFYFGGADNPCSCGSFMLVPCHLPNDGGSLLKFAVGQVLRDARSRKIANSRVFHDGIGTVINGEK